VPAMTRTFGTLRTIDGYDVIATDSGRAVAHRATHASANGVAFVLNDAAAGGAKALARAFKSMRAESNPSDPSSAGHEVYDYSDGDMIGLDSLVP
jgi:hypothetical protein